MRNRTHPRRTILATLALLAAFITAEHAVARGSALQSNIEAIVGRLRTASASVVALDQDGNILVDVEGESPRKPASTMKVLTSLAALEVLGVSDTFQTRLYTNGDIRDGTLHGDLILRGEGDPTISGRFYRNNERAIFQDWAGQLQRRGIQHITGDVIGDDRCFDRQYTAAGWEQTDLTRWYSARISGLVFNDSCADLVCDPGAAGQPPTLSLRPACRFFILENNVRTTASGAVWAVNYNYSHRPNAIEVTGRIRHDAKRRVDTFAVPNPTWWAAAMLAEVLLQQGIGLDGLPHDVNLLPAGSADLHDLTLLIEHNSPELPTILEVVNRRSQNLFAEVLLKRVGLRANGVGSFAAGAAATRRVLAQYDIDTTGLYQVDGSGLSHDNRVTAMQLARALHVAHDQPAFRESLPMAGQAGTSMRNYLGENQAQRRHQDKVRAKTGFIRGVRALCGYVDHPNGEWLTFAILVNDLPNAQGSGRVTVTNVLMELVNWRPT